MSSTDPAQQAAALPVLLVNGVRQASCPARPAEMLMQHEQGPYTTALVREGLRIEAWPRHTARLAAAVLRLHEVAPDIFSRLTESLQEGEDAEPQLQRLIDANLRNDVAVLAAGAAADRMAVTILLCSPAASSDRVMDVVMHAMQLPAPPEGSPREVEAAVVGPGRRLPEVKHSQWVTDRQPLMANMSESAAEGILCDAQGHLLEGMLTNLFIIADDGSGGAMVATAAVADGVLPGVMRHYVIAACEALGVPVVLRAPHWSSHDRWQEAFLTNSLRGLQPLKRIVCTRCGICGDELWAVTLPPLRRDSLTDQLRRHVEQQLAAEAHVPQPEVLHEPG